MFRPDASDESLMEALGKGEEEAFTELIRRYQEKLLNFFYRLGVYTDAEDLVQETMVRVYKNRGKYRAEASFSTWLYTIARNCWRDKARKAFRINRIRDEYQEEADGVQRSHRAASAARMDVRDALDQLSEKLREVLILRIYQGLDYKEIAEVMEIPLGTVKSRLNLAVTEVRNYLEQEHG